MILDWLVARPIAHRGLHDAKKGVIENTRSAFDAAMAHGFGIECDIQASQDGEAMVFHDFSLERLTSGHGRVDSHSADALGKIAFHTTQDSIEPLSALLARVAGRVPLVVEVKSAFDGNSRIAARVAEIVKDYAGPLALKSFDPQMMLALRAAGIRQPIGIVGMSRYEFDDFAHLTQDEKRALAQLLHFSQTRPDFLSWFCLDLPSAGPYLCRTQLNLPVMSWTVRNTKDEKHVRPHADQIVFEGFLPA